MACFPPLRQIDHHYGRARLRADFLHTYYKSNIYIMKLNRFELAGILASVALVIMAGVFAVTQTAYADVDPCSLPGMGMLGCDDNEGDTGVPVDPCDITPCNDDEPSLGEEITCEVYEELMAQGEPIPQGFDASGCEDDDDNGGGGHTPACADGIDNDNDGSVDMTDPGCADSNDDDESNGGGGGSSGPAACNDLSDNDGDGLTDMADPGCTDVNDTDETDPATGGSGSSGGSSGGSGNGGSVSGAATTTCDTYLTKFIKFGQQNDEEQVKRLQYVLKTYEGAAVEENGTYDQETLSAVHAFQTKYWDTILAPWDIKQSTGYVYLTTRKKVNEIYCKNELLFPLSEEENALIEATKKPGAVAGHAVKPVTKPAEKPAGKTETKNTEKKVQEPADEGATKRSGWGAVGDFFKRLFNRGR